MATLLEDLEQFVLLHGIGKGDGIDMFRDTIPDEPDEVIVFYEYDGRTASTLFNPTIVRYVQVTVRHPKASVSRAKALSIFKLFQSEDEGILDLPNDRWAIVKPLQSPFKLNEDGKSRSYYGFNMAITTNCE